MVEILNWDKLKPYNSTQNKSFEELCFQLCIEEYKLQGNFVRIDDSGGGDGVEYYLEFPNGDIWGWQCKFFGRFDEGGRKEQIKKSLQTAYNRHSNKLKRWILCSKMTLTNEEKNWFDTIGKLTHKGVKVLPDDNALITVHWGDSILLNLLRQYPSIHKFFFTDKILNDNWFKERFDLVYNSSVIKTKYLDSLHTKGEVDDYITRRLGGKELVNLIEKNEDSIGIYNFQKEYNKSIKRIRDEENKYSFNEIYDEISDFLFSNKYDTIVNDGAKLLEEIKEYLAADNYKLSFSLESKIHDYKTRFRDFYEMYVNYKSFEKLKSIHWDDEALEKDKDVKDKIKNCRETLLGPYFTLRNYDYFLGTFEELDTLKCNEIHISGNASKGKTHIAVDVVKKHLGGNKPAIFIFGKSFKSDLSLKEQLRSILDLPTDWNINDFLAVLDIAGRVRNTKAILLIDGLNEAVKWKSVFGDNLEELINEIYTRYPNILFITTFRTSYKNELFPKNYFHYNSNNADKLTNVTGFTQHNVEEAMGKYFKHYDITLEHSSGAINAFAEPLYLKIFCETKRGKSVSFQNEDLFDVFEEYLIKCNEDIIEKLGKDIRLNKKFTSSILEKISNYLWENSAREIPLEYVIENILNQEELLVFEKEDLLIFRDWNNIELITFTYDLLSGYLIAKKMLESIDSEKNLMIFIKSSKFKNELLIRKTCHPLYNDILRSFCVLTIKKFGLNFYFSVKSETLKDYLLNSIFEVNQKIISDNKSVAINIITDNFKNGNKRNIIFNLFKINDLDSENPLNVNLLSSLLLEMKVSDRDLSWTEHIRTYTGSYNNYYKSFIEGFELISKGKKNLKSDKIHLAAKKVMWFLTSSNREFRDKCTRALYFYGRKYPTHFLHLVEYSLSINDPYIWERTLGALYGVVLAKHNDFEDKNFTNDVLPSIVLKLYELMFKKEARFSTTHLLARDYASKTIQIGLKYNSKLLNLSQKKFIKAPFKFGGNRTPKEYDYLSAEGIFSEPIGMDFSNYTIGRIVIDGHSYSDPPEKQKVRRQIYWRIYNLGWNEEQFKKVDNQIRQDNYRSSRGEQANIERYGKKYSWIAYYEIAGLRSDKKLIEKDWDEFRVSDADIDITFPTPPKNKKFVLKDLLGDRKLPLLDWYISGGKPDVSEYLNRCNLHNQNGNWICLDGYIVQEDKKIHREVFTFIRGMLIKNQDYDEVQKQIVNKDLGGRYLPDARSNYYTFAGELYCFDDAVFENSCELKFEIERKKIKVKKGEPGYYPTAFFKDYKIQKSFPKFIEIDKVISKEFEILLPVMSYNWESYHSELNTAGHETVVSKELVSHLKLTNKPQTFNLFDDVNNLATQNIRYKKNYNNSHRFVYLRQDLLDKFLNDNGYKLIWGIWGERQATFKNSDGSQKFHSENSINDLQVFSEIIEYK